MDKLNDIRNDIACARQAQNRSVWAARFVWACEWMVERIELLESSRSGDVTGQVMAVIEELAARRCGCQNVPCWAIIRGQHTNGRCRCGDNPEKLKQEALEYRRAIERIAKLCGG